MAELDLDPGEEPYGPSRAEEAAFQSQRGGGWCGSSYASSSQGPLLSRELGRRHRLMAGLETL